MVTIKEVTVIRAPIARCFDLARSVAAHLAGNVHWGEAAVAEGGCTSGLVDLGKRVTWRAKHFAIRQRLTSKITAMDRPVYFQDTMIEGPFLSMQHDHVFRTVSPDMTEMEDVFASPRHCRSLDAWRRCLRFAGTCGACCVRGVRS